MSSPWNDSQSQSQAQQSSPPAPNLYSSMPKRKPVPVRSSDLNLATEAAQTPGQEPQGETEKQIGGNVGTGAAQVAGSDGAGADATTAVGGEGAGHDQAPTGVEDKMERGLADAAATTITSGAPAANGIGTGRGRKWWWPFGSRTAAGAGTAAAAGAGPGRALKRDLTDMSNMTGTSNMTGSGEPTGTGDLTDTGDPAGTSKLTGTIRIPRLSRKRGTYLVIGVVIGVVVVIVLALVLGLALGLTIGRNHHSKHASPSTPPGLRNPGPFSGAMTFYQPGLGACGINSSPSQHVCALSHSVFDAAGKAAGGNSNGNPLCGRKIRIGGRGGGKTVEATVVDRCPGCSSRDVDVTTSVFKEMASLSQGRVGIKWEFVSG